MKMKLLPQIAVFHLCALVVSGAMCPAEEDLFPCKCGTKRGGVILSCAWKFIRQSHIERALGLMIGEEIAGLGLQNIYNLGTLQENLFSTSKIRSLSIYHCGIGALTDGNKPPFSGLEDSLESLVISSSLRSSSSLQFSHLQKVKSLEVYGNLFPKFNASFPASVKSLVLSANRIRNMPDGVFDNLTKVRSLVLAGNDLTTIRRSWLPQSKELYYIDLSGNLLTSLPQDVFSNLPALKTVMLDDNLIRSIEEKSLAGVWAQLEAIFIKDNPLVCDSKIKWIKGIKRGAILIGTCLEPENVMGMDVGDWLRQQASSDRGHLLE